MKTMKHGIKLLIGVILSLAWTACDNFFQELIPPDDNRIIEFLVDGQGARIGEDTISISWQAGWESEGYNRPYSVSIPTKATLLPITEEHIKNAFPSINKDKVNEMINTITTTPDSVIGFIKREKNFQSPGPHGSIDFSRQPVTLLVISGHGAIRRYTVQVMVTVTFNSNEGSPIPSQEVIYGSTASWPNPPPTRQFYNFGAWCTDLELMTQWKPAMPVNGNIILHARWNRPNEYTVFFESNCDEHIDPRTVILGETVGEPIPYFEGHEFLGWFDENDTLWDFETPIEHNVILYAKWKQNTYTVTFDPKGGIFINGSSLPITQQNIVYGGQAEYPGEPTRTDYRFGTWWDEENGIPYKPNMPIYGNVTFSAQWNLIDEFTVTYNADGGTPNYSRLPVHTGFQAPKLSVTKQGHTFLYWYDENGKEWTFTNGITRDLTLTAKWKKNKYTITYDSKGGDPEFGRPFEYDYETEITLPSVTRKGFKFAGWYDTETKKLVENTRYKVIKDISLYAKWVFTVTFEINPGISSPITKDVDPYTSVTPPNPEPYRFPFKLEGWYTDRTYSERWDFSKNVTESCSLYARWVHTVTFESDGGGPIPPPQYVDDKDPLSPVDAPQRAGYRFGGWIRKDTGLIWSFADYVTGSFTLKARWIQSCTVTFDSVGGMIKKGNDILEILTITVDTPSKVPRPEDPVKGKPRANPDPDNPKITGLVFGGWFTGKENGDLWNFTYEYVFEDITLYAKWIPVDMVKVPAGTFEMGSNEKDDEKPTHEVTLSNGFYMGKFEVTEELYSAVMENSYNNNKTPKINVTWYQAVKFCNALSDLQGLDKYYYIDESQIDPSNQSDEDSAFWDPRSLVRQIQGANGYRLPTEAEWEYAAKGGDGTPGNYKYSGSNTVGDVAWYRDNSKNQVHIVGDEKDPNGLGIYDMSGNVYEWCWDWYGLYEEGPQVDPTGPASGKVRVIRGGSFANQEDLVRSAARNYWAQSNGHPNYGFRVVSGACYNYDKKTDIGKWEGERVE